MEFGFALLSLMFFIGTDDTVAYARMPKPTPQIEKLISDLGDHQFKTRQDAHKKLKELDYAALSAVLGGLKNKDAEIRSRCQKILEDYFLVTTAFPEATRISKEGLVLEYKQNGKMVKYTIPREKIVAMYNEMWHNMGREMSYVWHEPELAQSITEVLVYKMRLWGVPGDVISKALKTLATQDLETGDICQPETHGKLMDRGFPRVVPKTCN